MMDETFHLTPLDVRRYEFGKALRGYDPERVDQFREQVAEELERLTRLNQPISMPRPRGSTSSCARFASETRRSTKRWSPRSSCAATSASRPTRKRR